MKMDQQDYLSVSRLAADPMFQLSTAGQELFHSNFLYWLARERPAESHPIWDLLTVDAPASGDLVEVSREWKHVDLFIDSGVARRQLVLENKVLAVPDSSQLKRYFAEVSSHPRVKPDVVSWILLSLLPPSFDVPEPWRSVTYDDLLPPMEETARNLRDDLGSGLVAAYRGLLEKLLAVRDEFDPALSLDEPMTLDMSLRSRLREARILPLVEKMRMSRLAQNITAGLQETTSADHASIEVGLSNTHGLISWFTPGPRGRQFGWQVQSGQFRLVVVTGPKESVSRRGARLKREALVQREHLAYFDFEVPADLQGTLSGYSGKKEWLGYEPDFVYQYRPLTATTTWRQCADVCLHFSTRAVARAKTG
jgi:hypothetical protein